MIPSPVPFSRRSFLKTSAAWAGGLAISGELHQANALSPAKPLLAYVGTYSSPLPIVRPGQVDLPPGNGKGIHIFQVNRSTGAMTPHAVFEMATSPSSVTLNAKGSRLYSANETDEIGEEQSGSVSAFAVAPSDGRLTLLNTVNSGAAGPTHVSLHPSGKFLLVANYFGGAVSVFPILENGGLGPACDLKKDTGDVGPKTASSAPTGSFAISGHDLPHAHMIQSDASGRFVFSVDLGLDRILVWKFDEQTGKLAPHEPAFIPFPPGDGPRHFAFHPNGHWFYSIQEEGSTIALFDYDPTNGRFTQRQTLSSLPPWFTGSNFTSEIMVAPDGKFVYGANRLHDSIAAFAIAPDGTLKFLGEEWTRGDYPRSFNFDPSGNYLYCCNQRADNIAIFRVNHATGALTFTDQTTPVGNPSSIIFLDVANAG